MVTTFKALLNHRRQKADGTFPLIIRITVDRKHKEIPLNIFLYERDWDKKNCRVRPTHPNTQLITIKIGQVLTELQETVLKYETSTTVYTVEDIANIITRKQDVTTFFTYANQQVAIMVQTGRIGNSIAYKNAVSKLRCFAKNNTLRFESIDFKLLNSFANSMLSDGTKINTIALYMREIRAIYNRAIKEGIVEQKYYPFNKYTIKTAKTVSRTLSIGDMQKIVRLELQPHTPMWHARNYFLLSFCLIGINFTDMFLLTPNSIQNNRVMFSRSKTKKIYSIYLHPKAVELLRHYFLPENKPDYLLSVLIKSDSPIMVKKKALQAIKITNEYIGRIAATCEIRQDITTYYARYSWANIARSLGYSKDLIAESLGHSYGNAVTGIYLDCYSNETIDAANAKVIDAVFK